MDDAGAALALAESFLLRRPVEHNLVLSLLHRRRAQPEPGLYWAVLDGGEVVGLALRSPLDFVATLTPMSAPAVALLVDALIQDCPDLSGINGEASTVATFAGHWAERASVAAAPIEAHRLYQLHSAPERAPAPGTLRRADAEDAEMLAAWSRSFQTEVGLPHAGDIAEVTRRRVGEGRLWIWEDQGPVSAAGATAAVAGVARVNFVYTPPEHRRRGYAAACVSELSAHLLASEADTCVLYVQLANPTSNGVYRSIGYQAVTEILLYGFSTERAPSGGEDEGTAGPLPDRGWGKGPAAPNLVTGCHLEASSGCYGHSLDCPRERAGP